MARVVGVDILDSSNEVILSLDPNSLQSAGDLFAANAGKAQAEEEEKVLPRVMTFVVTPEQEGVIEQAVELASDGTAGRDRKARGK